MINAISLTTGTTGINGKIKILVVGSGNGYELVWFGKDGHDVTGLELYAPGVPYVDARTIVGSATDMPFKDKEFGLVFCTEMFEHVSEADTDLILNEINRVGEKFYITIATKHDPPYNTHINVQAGSYWLKKFEDMGFQIASFQFCPKIFLRLGKAMGFGLYYDGVTLYGDCKGS